MLDQIKTLLDQLTSELAKDLEANGFDALAIEVREAKWMDHYQKDLMNRAFKALGKKKVTRKGRK